MEKYSEYKDSGVEWLGEIPSHWEVIKAKFIWDELFNVSETGNEKLLSVSQYDGITEAKNDSRSESLTGYKLVRENDLVINIMLAWMGGLGVSAYNGIVSPAYCIYRLKRDSNPKFMHYLYKTPLYLTEFARHSTGVIPSRWRMYTDDFGQVLTLLPPKEEQDAIVRYLDYQSSKIDEAIAQQQKMIDLLNERKQIIINNAVTKGLDPNVPMKDSGVDWIGMIPEHWEKNKIFRLFRKIGSGTTPKGDAFYESGSIPWVNSGDLNNSVLKNTCKYVTPKALKVYSALKVYPKNSIIIAMYGASIGKIALSNIDACTNQACCVLNDVSKELLLKYAFYALMNCKKNWIEQSIGGTQPNISAEKIKNTWICFPGSIVEQQAILTSLERSLEIIDRMIIRHNDYILLLQERKQIIINEVVTGKVKVS